jgi:hypothetical protein
MNASISKIENALTTIRKELAEIEKEVPGLSRRFWWNIEIPEKHNGILHLELGLAKSRLITLALAKLTPQEIEAVYGGV